MPDKQTGGDWIQTYTGRKVWPLAMKAADIDIDDIAHSLANQCRFTGHVKEFYSVAQHSVLASYYCDPDNALWGLLHDATEAYLIDVPRPLKRHADFAFYRSAESDCMRAICEAFGLQYDTPNSVHVADRRLLATESRDLMAPLHPDWHVAAEPYRRRIAAWDPQSAKFAFLSRFRRLTTSFETAKFEGLEYRGTEVATA